MGEWVGAERDGGLGTLGRAPMRSLVGRQWWSQLWSSLATTLVLQCVCPEDARQCCFYPV